ncbi:MAG: sigma-70 family RNA polymerase sigma factor [Phycisphaeraceae bacterium]|nr:sigma-70 family RNA polymerase sigma factor [Phycisphaeraceae bacterium]
MSPVKRSNPAAPCATPLSERTAEELAVLAQRDNLAAYGVLVERYEARLFNFLLRRVGRRIDAEDLTQESFVRAWERIRSYDPTWRFSTWLFTIASRLAVSHLRRRRASVSIESIEVSQSARHDTADHESNLRTGGLLWALAARILKREQHTALWLRYAEDMSVSEIAMVMGKSQVGVRVCLFRARRTLAESARKAGIVVNQPDPDLLADNDTPRSARRAAASHTGGEQ